MDGATKDARYTMEPGGRRGAVAVARRGALGTDAGVALWPPDGLAVALGAVDAEIGLLHLQASRFRADSEVSRIAGSRRRVHEVTPGLAEAVQVALAAARWTGGLVDPTVGGASPGAGVVGVPPASACGLAETARLTRYLASSSAGQCSPCVFGLDAIARELEQAAAGGRCDLSRVRRWLRDVTGRGACRHPDGTALMVTSALRVLRAEITRHERGWCGATTSAGILPVQEPGS